MRHGLSGLWPGRKALNLRAGDVDDLHILDFALFDAEAEGGAHGVPALEASGAGVEGHHVVVLVEFHPKNVGMAADEDLRPEPLDQGLGAVVVAPRVAADVGHQDRHPAAFEETVAGVFVPQVVVVAVAVDADEGLEGSDFAGGFESAAEVAGMPELVAGRQEILERLVEDAVGVGKEADVHGGSRVGPAGDFVPGGWGIKPGGCSVVR